MRAALESHNRAFAAIGGVAALLVPDNTKVAVIKACLHDPVINRTYADMAAHYGTAVLPARPYKPRDKAKVEVGVLIAERWLLGRLRKTVFHSLAELNVAAAEFCRRLNDDRIIRRVNRTRRQLLNEVDRPALRPLPGGALRAGGVAHPSGGIDYHVDAENHFYSVPYRLARAEVDVRLTARTVEVFLRGERMAAHRRGSGDGRHTTAPDRMPSSHRRYAGWTIERINQEAAAIGPTVGALCTLILERRPHPEQGFRACLGILKLERSVGAARLDAAAARAIEIGGLTYGSVKSILDNKLEQRPIKHHKADLLPIRHPSIRGSGYFH